MAASLVDSIDDLQKLLDDAAAQNNIPGASIAVVHDGEQVELATGVLNSATQVPVRTTTPFLIGSISKVWTATMVLQLVDEGRIGLDDAVVTYLPDLRLGGGDDASAVTVRQLLSHTCGIDEDFMVAWGDWEDSCIATYVDGIASRGQLHPPGALFSYNNTGWVIAGRLLEVLDGDTYDAIVKKRLIEPLGLQHTVCSAEEAILLGPAVGHVPGADGSLRVVDAWTLPRAFGPAGGTICASAGDLLRFARAHLGDGQAPAGPRMLSTESATQMREPQMLMPGAATPEQGAQGLGWALSHAVGELAVSHGGGNIGQHCGLFAVPGRGLAIAALTNSLRGAPFHAQLYRTILADRLGLGAPVSAAAAATSAPPAPDLKIDPSRYVGTYRRGEAVAIIEDDGAGSLTCRASDTSEVYRFYGSPPPKADAEVVAVPMRPVSETVFVFGGAAFYGGDGTRVLFVDLDGDGLYEYLYVGNSVSRRVDA